MAEAHVHEFVAVLAGLTCLVLSGGTAFVWWLANEYGPAAVVVLGAVILLPVIVGGFLALSWTDRVISPYARSYLRTIGGAGTTRKITAADGTALHVEIEGPADADTTVVFLHGWMVDLDSWKFQRTMLARGVHGSSVRRVFFDMRGHGRSAWSSFDDRHDGARQLAQDLRDVIAAVAPTGRLVLVGHSAGGMTIMAAAASQPDMFSRVDGVLLVATSDHPLREHLTLGLHRRLYPAHAVMRRYAAAAFLLLGALPRPLTRIFGMTPWALGSRFMATTRGATQDAIAHTAVMLYGTHLGVAGEVLHNLLAHDERELCPAALGRTRVTAIVPERDRLIPREIQEATARSVPGARLVRVPDTGHMVATERPDLVNAELLHLLDHVTTPAAADPRKGRA